MCMDSAHFVLLKTYFKFKRDFLEMCYFIFFSPVMSRFSVQVPTLSLCQAPSQDVSGAIIQRYLKCGEQLNRGVTEKFGLEGP